jgi:Ca-activated chloride channel homolog
MTFRLLITSLLFVFFVHPGFSQKARPLTRVLIIFDASNSMYSPYEGSTRIETAKKMFKTFADSLSQLKNTEFALRLYGHQKPVPPQDCSDTGLEIPFTKNNLDAIKERIRTLTPRGTTPIARSLIEAADDFPNTPGVNIIILITDGIEECGGNICDAAAKLREKGIQFRPFVIGIALSANEAKSFDCVGPYYDISTPGVFSEIVDVIITQTMYNTTAQVNLLDVSGKPTETNINMSFYDRKNGNLIYNYVHTLNAKGNPDTLKIDASYQYRMVVHTIPSVEKDSIILFPGKHNIIAADTPQGKLQIRSGGSAALKKIPCLISIAGTPKTIHVQDLNTIEKYLTGNYDVEVLTLPRLKFKDVEIFHGSTKTLDVPRQGIIRLNYKEPVYGSIVLIEKDNNIQWVADLSENATAEEFQLLPGNYKIIFRPKNKKETIYTTEKEIKVLPDASLNINL